MLRQTPIEEIIDTESIMIDNRTDSNGSLTARLLVDNNDDLEIDEKTEDFAKDFVNYLKSQGFSALIDGKKGNYEVTANKSGRNDSYVVSKGFPHDSQSVIVTMIPVHDSNPSIMGEYLRHIQGVVW
ncbi:MAG: hypothetical protein AABW73_01510 [Nanoarchaeota archaeon]